MSTPLSPDEKSAQDKAKAAQALLDKKKLYEKKNDEQSLLEELQRNQMAGFSTTPTSRIKQNPEEPKDEFKKRMLQDQKKFFDSLGSDIKKGCRLDEKTGSLIFSGENGVMSLAAYVKQFPNTKFSGFSPDKDGAIQSIKDLHEKGLLEKDANGLYKNFDKMSFKDTNGQQQELTGKQLVNFAEKYLNQFKLKPPGTI